MRRRLAGLLPVLLALWAAPGTPANLAATTDLDTLKAAYLYHFTQFIQWPETALGPGFVITVVDDPALAVALGALEAADKRAQGRPIRVQARARGERIGDCQLLFIGTAALADLPELLAQTAGRAVLTVGDGRGLIGRGVGIGLFLKPDILGAGARLRFAIDRRALTDGGLKVSAQLYDVAAEVQ